MSDELKCPFCKEQVSVITNYMTEDIVRCSNDDCHYTAQFKRSVWENKSNHDYLCYTFEETITDLRRQLEEERTRTIDTAINIAEHDVKFRILNPYLKQCDSEMPYWDICGYTFDSLNEAFEMILNAPRQLAAAIAKNEDIKQQKDRIFKILKSERDKHFKANAEVDRLRGVIQKAISDLKIIEPRTKNDVHCVASCLIATLKQVLAAQEASQQGEEGGYGYR